MSLHHVTKLKLLDMHQDTLNIRVSIYWGSDDVNKLSPQQSSGGLSNLDYKS